ncbi:MAG: hypothetical protein ACKV2T_25920 [Kofleriaceae bacterium]
MRSIVMSVSVLASRVASVIAVLASIAAPASAQPAAPLAPRLVELAVPADDDARTAIAIGPRGEVYEPDGKGAWVRDRSVTVTNDVTIVGRANGVVALAGGAVYRLAENGWSALRLVQKGKAVMSGGTRSVAAVGRQLFALDKLAGGEVAKLAMAPQPVQLIGAGTKALTIQTERGLLRAEGPGAPWKPIARAPRRVERLLDDRWAIEDRNAVDLKTGATTAFPAGFELGAATTGPKGSLVLVGTHRGVIELVTIAGVKLQRETIERVTKAAAPSSPAPSASSAPAPSAPAPSAPAPSAPAPSAPAPSTPAPSTPAPSAPAPSAPAPGSIPAAPLAEPVAIVTDTAGRVVVAFRDGRIAVRERGAWSVTMIRVALPVPRPGARPAMSP